MEGFGFETAHALLEQADVEVDEKAKGEPGKPEVGKQLGAVNG